MQYNKQTIKGMDIYTRYTTKVTDNKMWIMGVGIVLAFLGAMLLESYYLAYEVQIWGENIL